jgi:hypothetical protein
MTSVTRSWLVVSATVPRHAQTISLARPAGCRRARPRPRPMSRCKRHVARSLIPWCIVLAHSGAIPAFAHRALLQLSLHCVCTCHALCVLVLLSPYHVRTRRLMSAGPHAVSRASHYLRCLAVVFPSPPSPPAPPTPPPLPCCTTTTSHSSSPPHVCVCPCPVSAVSRSVADSR